MTAARRAHRLPEHGRLPEFDPSSTVEQRWYGGWHSWVRRSDGGFNPDRYEVHPISDPVAKSYVERMHYSGSYVAASRRYGLFVRTPDGLDLVGVAVFAVPAQPRVLTNVFPELRPYVESLELARFVLEGQPLSAAGPSAPAGRAPGNSESWFLRQCYRFLAVDGIAGVVSFADPVPRVVAGRTLFVGHVGTIYQSSNAVLTGRSTPRYLIVLPDGTSLSDRALQKVRAQDVGHSYVERRLHALGARRLRAGMNPAVWVWDALDDVHAVRLRHGGNLRYAMLTSRAARREVLLRLPSGADTDPGSFLVGTVSCLAGRGITGLPYPKQLDG
ncbi:hypothetical protein [Dactylosporangium sp. CA-092794]|uniref:Mom family adenine methylcarbamoylation protein n=1 Tax=Dactylosporangium sp. CA-092794 TaxID=3239929 RepID=UPI003D8B85C9